MEERRNLYYVCTHRDVDRLLVENVTKEEADKFMSKFMAEHDFVPYYIRSWEDPEGCRHYDVGSYTEFFEWRKV